MLTVITAGVMAQKKDTLLLHNSPFVGSAQIYIYTPPSLPNDTVRCSMLATDTTTLIAFQYEGYEVREWHIGLNPAYNVLNQEKHSGHVAYLTKEYKPIPGNLIIWLSKNK